jgi:hypothetical protein
MKVNIPLFATCRVEFACCGERGLAPETSAINDEQYAAARPKARLEGLGQL